MAETNISSAYREDFVCWASNPGEDFPYDHEHDGDCQWGWICHQPDCGWRADELPCPEHAPTVFLGLRLVECQATPRHYLFAYDREDYGHGCPWCWWERAAAELALFRAAAERRAHRWCWLSNPVKRLAIRLGVARARSYSGSHACWHIDARWRWSA